MINKNLKRYGQKQESIDAALKKKTWSKFQKVFSKNWKALNKKGSFSNTFVVFKHIYKVCTNSRESSGFV